MLKRCCLLATLAATPAAAGTMPAEPLTGSIRVIDGDTIETAAGEIVRIYNIDAPESHAPRCPAEGIAGAAATALVVAWTENQPLTISRCEPATGRCLDRYKRTLATIATPAGDIGDRLVAAGAALPWQPGPAAHEARRRHWCGR